MEQSSIECISIQRNPLVVMSQVFHYNELSINFASYILKKNKSLQSEYNAPRACLAWKKEDKSSDGDTLMYTFSDESASLSGEAASEAHVKVMCHLVAIHTTP